MIQQHAVLNLKTAAKECWCLQTLDLSEVYLGLSKHKDIYNLRSMVCYYGQHYLAYVLMPGNTWFMFDDASMQRVGAWADVISKSSAGRTQASVLFYEHE